MSFRATVLVVLAACPGFAQSGALPAVTHLGRPLNSDIIDIFVPPTRADGPYAALAMGVFSFKSDVQDWVPVYRVNQPETQVLDIEGYEKSSEPLYVALTDGVARTRDAGVTWIHAAPRGFDPVAEGFGGLAVNPNVREEALVATKRRAWRTSDYGENWNALALPQGVGEIAGVAFTKSDSPELIVWGEARIFWSRTHGASWVHASNAPGPIQAAAVSAHFVDAYVGEATPSLLRMASDDLINGAQIASSLPGLVVSMAGDAGEGRGVWLASGNGVHYCEFNRGSLESLAQIRGPFTKLTQHPRQSGSVYAALGRQVQRISIGNVNSSEPDAPMSLVRWESTVVEGRLPESETALVNSADELVRRVLNSQPPVRAAVAAALEYAGYDPDEVRTWRNNARRRNALPELSVRAGTRKYPTDVFETANAGTPLVDDIHLSDDLSDLDYAEVEVRWDLSDLLFDADEPAVSEEARERAADRNALTREIATLYYERTELIVRILRDSRTMDADTHLKSAIELHRMTELLNELCGDSLFTATLP